MDEALGSYLSPLSRHELEDWQHFVVFCVHDISSIISCGFFVYLFALSLTDPYHKIIGRICGVNFVVTVISGFVLVYARKTETMKHITPSLLNTKTITTQGFCVLGICFNAFLLKRHIYNRLFPIMLVCFHIYGILMGLRSLHFLYEVIWKTDKTCYDKHFVEVAIELLCMITIPQLIIDLIFIYLLLFQSLTHFRGFVWKLHHEMSVVFLIYMSVTGLMFTISHDSYWLFSSPIETIWGRMNDPNYVLFAKLFIL